MTLIINGSGLRIEDVVNVARNNQKVELHPEALERMKNAGLCSKKRLKITKLCMV